MSARDVKLSLSPRARKDLANLLLYSERQWGNEQRATYKASIDEALQSIARFPEIGVSRLDLDSGRRSLTIKQHTIFYRILESGIRVDRILHVRMDAAPNLDI